MTRIREEEEYYDSAYDYDHDDNWAYYYLRCVVVDRRHWSSARLLPRCVSLSAGSDGRHCGRETHTVVCQRLHAVQSHQSSLINLINYLPARHRLNYLCIYLPARRQLGDVCFPSPVFLWRLLPRQQYGTSRQWLASTVQIVECSLLLFVTSAADLQLNFVLLSLA